MLSCRVRRVVITMVVSILVLFAFSAAPGSASAARPRSSRDHEQSPSAALVQSSPSDSALNPGLTLRGSAVFSEAAPAAAPSSGADRAAQPWPRRPQVTTPGANDARPHGPSNSTRSPYALYVSAGAGISWPLGIGGGASVLGSYEVTDGWCLGPYAAAATAGGTSSEMDSRLWLVHGGVHAGWTGTGERLVPLLLGSLGYGVARVHDREEAYGLYSAHGPLVSARIGMFSRELRALSLLRFDLPLFAARNEYGLGGARHAVMIAAEIGFRFGL